MIKINLASFEEHTELELRIIKADLPPDKAAMLKNDITAELTLTKDSEKTVIVEGRINADLVLKCSRCLADIDKEVSDDFLAIYKDKAAMTDEDRENDVIPYTNNEIDIFDNLWETVLLDVPMKPLCKEDCGGLCPKCGTNLNENKCSCEKEIKLNPFMDIEIKIQGKKKKN